MKSASDVPLQKFGQVHYRLYNIYNTLEIEQFIENTADDKLIVLDEAYAEICPDELPDWRNYILSKRPLIITRTFSKAYAAWRTRDPGTAKITYNGLFGLKFGLSTFQGHPFLFIV